MAKSYEIIGQQAQVIIKGGVPTNGYLIRARLVEFDEYVNIEVTRLDPDLIDHEIRVILDKRRKLADLGNDS